MVTGKKKVRKRYSKKFKIRKIIFWVVLLFLFLVCIGFIFSSLQKNEVPRRFIRVGICGAVHIPAVYTVREGADLGMLIRYANGLRTGASIYKINLEKIVQNDSIYHIPYAGKDDYKLNHEFLYEVNRTIKASYNKLTNNIDDKFKNQEIRKYNILYVGLPAVYVLITYYPDYNRINFVHIPHTTLFLDNKYRLIDMFFTLDIYPTMRIIEHEIGQKIDYYLIQDRTKFIDLINLLGGITLNLDEAYANEYKLRKGKTKVDGFYAWEYIRFMDWNNIQMTVNHNSKLNLITTDNFEANPAIWERIYEVRNQRQRYVLQAMRASFRGLSEPQQLYIVNHFKDVFQTDMSPNFLIKLYGDILSTNAFNFGNLPGYYGSVDNNLYYYPNLPNFRMLVNQETRRLLESNKPPTRTVY